jgi:hypothetical protein
MGEPRQPRIVCYQRAWLTLLKEDRAFSVRAVQLSGRSIRIVLSELVELETAVSIETGDWMALGDVRWCRGEYSHFVAELQLEQMLIGLQELRALQRGWFSGASHPPSFVVHVAKQPVA